MKLLIKSNVEDRNTQTPALEQIIGIQSLRETSTLMRRSENVCKLEEKPNGDVFWKGLFLQSLGENRKIVKNEDYNIRPKIQSCVTNTKLTIKSLDNDGKETVIDLPNEVGLYDIKQTKCLKSAGMNDALHNLAKTITEVINPPLPETENIEDCYEEIFDNNLEG